MMWSVQSGISSGWRGVSRGVGEVHSVMRAAVVRPGAQGGVVVTVVRSSAGSRACGYEAAGCGLRGSRRCWSG